MKSHNSLILCITLTLAACNAKPGENVIDSTSITNVGIMPTAPHNPISIVYSSIDGGNTWHAFDHGIPPDATISSFLVQDDKIFASTDYDGIYFIKAMEKQWKRIDEDLPKGIDINTILIAVRPLSLARSGMEL
jgi:photosystem II stability/assembly factor-like uncharacterized protein